MCDSVADPDPCGSVSFWSAGLKLKLMFTDLNSYPTNNKTDHILEKGHCEQSKLSSARFSQYLIISLV